MTLILFGFILDTVNPVWISQRLRPAEYHEDKGEREMKRIKTVNGYAIYQAVSERDAENYSCAVGSYNLYLATDVRDYGLANSSPEYEDIDSLANALELANGSNHAIAEALAEELGGSTCIDMDLVLEIERRLDAGEDQEAIREELEPYVLDEDDEEVSA